MVVLIAGAGGQLGSTVTEALVAAGHEVAAVTHSDLDTLDVARCRRVARAVGPAVVIDCAEVRRHADGALRIAQGAYNLAATARAVGAFSVFISCAEVFGGDARRAYLESDPPRPVDEFGKAKLSAELAVASANERAAIVRTSWLFGLGGNNLVEATLNDASVSDAVLADSGTRSCPTYAGHLAAALETLVIRPAYGVFHMAGTGSCTKLEFARSVLRAAEIDVPAAPLDPGAGILPKRQLVLNTIRSDIPRLPDWRAGLLDYLDARNRASAIWPRARDGRDDDTVNRGAGGEPP